MTLRNSYTLTVRTENYIPHDVLVEHLAVCLKSLNFIGKVKIDMNSVAARKPHPFDGPEVFDDVKAEEYTGPRPTHAEGGFTGTGEYKYQPAGIVHKGSFYYPKDSLMGAEDPYPLTTNAIDALKEARDGGA